MSQTEASKPVKTVHDNQKKVAEEYQQKKRSFATWLPLTAVSLALNFFLGWLAFVHFPTDEFVPTTNAAAICRVSAINVPNLDYATVIEYATDAAVSVNTYDYKSYQRQIEDVAQRFFTIDFRNAYVPAFGNSKTLQTVRDSYYVVSSTAAGTGRRPMVSRVSPKLSTGPAWWVVDVPLLVSYTAGSKAPQQEKLLLQVTVSRVPPTRANSRGIAVTNIQSSYLLN